jgi:hypothetical protein
MSRALLMTAALLLAACAQPQTEEDAGSGEGTEAPVILGTHSGLPSGLSRAEKLGGDPVAAIVASGRVALTTWGSSSCPEVPISARVGGTGALRVVVGMDGSPQRVCTADMGPSTTRLAVDPALTEDGEVEVLLVFRDGGLTMRLTARPTENG